ncbi:hypothetical protein ABIE67_000194 [Streptomyces sp. V4I8]|uniref:hypothetical protein n=1 Tax=Streptomyces sp. V4I8 TaxID=3156469 RepID=UPI0035170FCE
MPTVRLTEIPADVLALIEAVQAGPVLKAESLNAGLNSEIEVPCVFRPAAYWLIYASSC